jgi:hypothetical protein
MHALQVTVTIQPGHAEEGQEHLEANVVPRAKTAPGFISGYWTRSADGEHGFSFSVFESEESARGAADMIPNTPRPDFITFDSIEVQEIVAQT